MKNFTELIELLRAERPSSSPSQLARIVVREANVEVGQFYLINVFDEAFPEIPFRDMIRASRWHQVCKNGISDAEFDAMLSPWFNNDD